MTSPQGPRLDSADPLIGSVLDDRYRLEERIGGGGMGEVYRARHLRMDQAVAVKVLHPELSADPMAARRFTREAKHTFRFDHPHCVRVLDFGATPDGRLFLVMEHLTGRTAAQEIAVDGPMAAARVVHIARQICAALGYAHDLGFVHRDLKPDNLMLLHRGGDPDFVKMLDFGLAKLFEGPDALCTAAFSRSALTREGSVFGTPEYMAPEQAMDEPLGPTADIYALGVTMYEMLTGLLPFEGKTFTELLAHQVQSQPVPPAARRPDLAIPAPLNGLILACMAKAPGARPQSAHALAAELDRLAGSLQAPPARRPQAPGASETIDLRAVSAMAAPPSLAYAATMAHTPVRPEPAAEPAAVPGPAAGSASHGLPALPAARASAVDPGAAALPARRVSTEQVHRHGRGAHRRPRRLVLLAAAAVLGTLGMGALAAVLWRQATPNTPAAPRALAAAPAAAAQRPAASPDTAPAATTPPPSAPAPAPTAATPGAIGPAEQVPADPGAPAAAVQAGPLDPTSQAARDGQAGSAGTQRASTDTHAIERASRRREAARHLAAAESARRQGNRLKQIGEADSALRLDPGNRRAAYLLGDALLAGGDEENGCKYLRRARTLEDARRALRRAGCPDD